MRIKEKIKRIYNRYLSWLNSRYDEKAPETKDLIWLDKDTIQGTTTNWIDMTAIYFDIESIKTKKRTILIAEEIQKDSKMMCYER